MRAARFFTATAICALVAVFSGTASATPPNGIWTCAYIASHPSEAAAALVSCSARGPVVVPGVVPLNSPFSTFSTLSACSLVPTDGGYISMGVFAWSNFQVFNHFSYSPAVVESFTWYVQNGNGVNVSHGDDTQTNDHAVALGDYRWGAQNHGGQVQRWTFCWTS